MKKLSKSQKFTTGSNFGFKIEKKIPKALGRAGVLETPHGKIETPAFAVVGTKATVKALTPEQVEELGGQIVLANTYHLYLEPGHKIVEKGGGLGKFLNWNGPTITDSGGFQVFSLGVAFGKNISKLSSVNGSNNKNGLKDTNSKKISEKTYEIDNSTDLSRLIRANKRIVERYKNEKMSKTDGGTSKSEKMEMAKIDEDGVTFKSVIDGSTHRFTPEKSIQIQHSIGADIIFAFDECTSPEAPHAYQKEAMDRTHRWAKRSLDEHNKINKYHTRKTALFGIVQGGRFEDLRKESAREISKMDFGGFGIGGSFDKKDMGTAVKWVNEILPEEKPRHLLGIGEPADIFGGIENGCDLFDCVAPTRQARNGSLYTKNGRMNILNAKFKNDFKPIEKGCECYTCRNYTRAYLSHLFRSKELLANTLASIHNLYFINHLFADIRQSILGGKFFTFKKSFLNNYYRTKSI
ncbi:MAG: tRNA guanosine(34) transglycosylase Tgt [Candidatus Paceibacterota bacterium]